VGTAKEDSSAQNQPGDVLDARRGNDTGATADPAFRDGLRQPRFLRQAPDFGFVAGVKVQGRLQRTQPVAPGKTIEGFAPTQGGTSPAGQIGGQVDCAGRVNGRRQDYSRPPIPARRTEV